METKVKAVNLGEIISNYSDLEMEWGGKKQRQMIRQPLGRRETNKERKRKGRFSL